MEGFKEFLGKTLDAAIAEACSYYNASREKLEIEIIQDAKTGIFGIVGARKAKVRARRAALREAVENALGRGSRPAAPEPDAPTASEDGDAPAASTEKPQPAREARASRSAPSRDGSAGRRSRGREEERPAREGEPREGRRGEERGQKPPRKAIASREETLRPATTAPGAPAGADTAQPDDKAAEAAPENAGARRRNGPESAPRQELPRNGEKAAGRERRRPPADDDLDEADDSLPRRALEELDQDRLRELARQCVSQLIRPMLSQPVEDPEVDIVDGRIRVAVDCGEDSGLLIGREGQTLAALQYLASRIVSRGMDAAVRVQLDAGRYRQRQEEKLRDMALALAAKVRQTGRSYSTRPLSSYHRRVIHLCLQDMDDVLTRSTGDGPLKRVVILRRRPEKGERQPQTERDDRRRAALVAEERPVPEVSSFASSSAQAPHATGSAPDAPTPTAAPAEQPTEQPAEAGIAPAAGEDAAQDRA